MLKIYLIEYILLRIKNTIPGETESPMVTSGLRLGSPAMTTRGFTESDFEQVGHIIATALKNSDNEEILENLEKRSTWTYK